MKTFIIIALIYLSILVGATIMQFAIPVSIISIPTDYLMVKENKWNGERYVGWDMPCNYTHGSTADDKRFQGTRRFCPCLISNPCNSNRTFPQPNSEKEKDRESIPGSEQIKQLE